MSDSRSSQQTCCCGGRLEPEGTTYAVVKPAPVTKAASCCGSKKEVADDPAPKASQLQNAARKTSDCH